MRTLLVVLLLCFVIGFLTPASYWSLVHLSRLVVWMSFGFVIGYFVRGLKR